MTQEGSYRLGRYNIIEETGGGLSWESHNSVGILEKGRCFIEGKILIIGPKETEEPGFLMREFMEHLNKLPPWRKTRYYCLGQSLHRCDSVARITFNAEIVKYFDRSYNPRSDKFSDRQDSGKERMITGSSEYKKKIQFKKIIDGICKKIGFIII